MTRTMTAAGLLLTLALASCGTTETAGTPDRTEAADSTGDRQASAASALETAINELRRANTGQYVQELKSPTMDELMLRTTGNYDLARGAVEMVIEAKEPGGESATLVNRLVDGQMYMNAQAWSEEIRDCWLTLDEQSLSDGTGLPLAPEGERFPVALSALDLARGETLDVTDDALVHGTVDLFSAVGVVAPKYALGLSDDQVRGRAEARFALTDGALTGMVVDGEAVLRGLEENFDVADEAATVLGVLSVEVNYSGFGELAAIEAPPAELRMTAEQMDAEEGCGG